MRLLLDTQAFLWWDAEPERLGADGLSALRDGRNTVLLSVVSAWEIEIKRMLGKLALRLPLAKIVEDQRHSNGVIVVPVALAHVLALDSLPPHHRDPFDRLLVVQARVENAVLVTNDPMIARYDANRIW